MIKNFHPGFFLFSLLLFIFIFPFLMVSAAPNLDYVPMETIPGFAKTADFAVFISNLYKFGIWTVGISALIMIVIGGYMYAASGGNNASMEKAKGFITDALVGLILAFLAYLILYIINPDLVKIKMGASTTGGGTPSGGSAIISPPKPANCTGKVPANSTLCTNINPASPTSISLMVGACTNVPCSYGCNNGWKASGSNCVPDKPANCTGEVPSNSTLCSSAQTTSAAVTLVKSCASAPCTYVCNSGYEISGKQCVAITTTGTTCPFSGKDLCLATNCNAPNCLTTYSKEINKAASGITINGVNSAKLINSIMGNESSCRISEKESAGGCGLMQLKPDTANRFKNFCGVSANIDCSWLTNPANAEPSICIGARYLAALAGGNCGASVRNIAAGYNGGPEACYSSTNCNGKSCDGQTVKAWECLYDDNAHLDCNEGFDVTRTYTGRVLACYNK